MTGMCVIWFKGAQDAMKFATLMHKSRFLGRKVQASLCRRAKPKTDDWNGVKDFTKATSAQDEKIEKARAAGTFTLFPDLEKLKEAPPPPPDFVEMAEREERAALAAYYEEDIAENASDEEEGDAEPKPKVQKFRLKQGTRVRLKDLESKPENNGKTGDVLK